VRTANEANNKLGFLECLSNAALKVALVEHYKRAVNLWSNWSGKENESDATLESALEWKT
jgi:hypothetical protein